MVKEQTKREIGTFRIDNVSFSDFNPGSTITITPHIKYIGLCKLRVCKFIVAGKNNHFACKIIGTIIENERYKGYPAVITIYRDGYPAIKLKK